MKTHHERKFFGDEIEKLKYSRNINFAEERKWNTRFFFPRMKPNYCDKLKS